MKCPTCGSQDQTGNFCAECGAPLRTSCDACGAELPPGSRFCTQCGEPVKGVGTRGRGSHARRLPWLVAGGAVVLAVLVFLIPRTADRAGPAARTGPAATDAPPALSGDMRVNADRLFARVMTARQEGDSAQAGRFTPMAVQAYGMVENLDADGLYHLALLHLAAGDFAAAQRTAGRILEGSPDHVLALGVAGAGAAGAGAEERARALYRRLLEVYPTEAARPLPEYSDHQQMLPEYRRAARAYLGEPES